MLSFSYQTTFQDASNPHKGWVLQFVALIPATNTDSTRIIALFAVTKKAPNFRFSLKIRDFFLILYQANVFCPKQDNHLCPKTNPLFELLKGNLQSRYFSNFPFVLIFILYDFSMLYYFLNRFSTKIVPCTYYPFFLLRQKQFI